MFWGFCKAARPKHTQAVGPRIDNGNRQRKNPLTRTLSPQGQSEGAKSFFGRQTTMADLLRASSSINFSDRVVTSSTSGIRPSRISASA